MASLYHEKQVSLLCGVHALNTLLQGPYFLAADLGAIAQEFDERERALMREAGVESADFLRYMAVRTCCAGDARVCTRHLKHERGSPFPRFLAPPLTSIWESLFLDGCRAGRGAHYSL
jgi:hypothetical protein